ncbi:MAG: outer membrane beta-barrel protein, partial [Pyrinomonadaceae bacterium]
MSLSKISAHIIRRAVHGFSVVLILLMLFSLNIQAQQLSPSGAAQPVNQSGNIYGDIQDAQGAIVPTARGESLAVNASKQTKAEGNRLLNFFRKTTVEGFIDLYFSYNFNRPAGRANSLRGFDTRDRRYSFNVAEIGFEKEATADSRIGFRLNLFYGPATDFLGASEPGGLKFYKNVQQAYISYLMPVRGKLQLDAGKFIPWAGAELDAAKDNWNYSRSLLYTLAQPSFHTGVRATYAFNDKVSLLGAIVNGWANVEENNRGKTYVLALTLTPVSKLSLTQSYTVGPEQPDDSRHKRHLLDTILTYNFNDRLSVMGNYDYGLERFADGSKARWQGLASYLRYQITKRIAFSPRFEVYYD